MASLVSVPVKEAILTPAFLEVLDSIKEVQGRNKRIADMAVLLGLDAPQVEAAVQRYDAYAEKQAVMRKAKEKAARAKVIFDKLNGRLISELTEEDETGMVPGLDMATEAVSLGMKLTVIAKAGNPLEDTDVGHLILLMSNVPTAPGAAAIATTLSRAPLVGRKKRALQTLHNGEVIHGNVADFIRQNYPDSIATAYVNHPSPPMEGLSLSTKYGSFQATQKDPAIAGFFTQVASQ
jgi:hypothetical protein